MKESELRERLKKAIGYDPVKLSIRDHPEITYEYRTIDDRDGLVDRITAELLPFLAEPEYEYGWAGDAQAQTFFATEEAAAEYMFAPKQFRRRKAGAWEDVPRTVDKEDSEA